MKLYDFLTQKQLIVSRAEGRRLLINKAVIVNGKIVVSGEIELNEGDTVQVGKWLTAKVE